MGRHSSCYLEGRHPAAEPQGTVVKGKEDGWAEREGGRKGREDGEREDGRRKETKSLNLGCYRFGHGV